MKKHKIKLKGYQNREYYGDIIIDGDKYEVGCNSDYYWVYKNNEKIPTEECKALLLECGYALDFHEEYDDFWTRWNYYATVVRVRTLKGVQGPYYDPDGNKWYSAWNETHSDKATK